MDRILLQLGSVRLSQVAVEINRLRAQTAALLNRRLRRARIPGLTHATAAASPSGIACNAGLATEVDHRIPPHTMHDIKCALVAEPTELLCASADSEPMRQL